MEPPTASNAPATSPPAAGAPPCDDRARIDIVDVSGAAGMRYAQIIVTNDQAAPCSVQGYPTAQLRGASGAPLGGPAAQIAGSADRIDLGPGESASTLLQVTTADCAASSAAFLEVSLAGGARTQAPSDLPPCQPRLRPLAPGAEPVP